MYCNWDIGMGRDPKFKQGACCLGLSPRAKVQN